MTRPAPTRRIVGAVLAVSTAGLLLAACNSTTKGQAGKRPTGASGSSSATGSTSAGASSSSSPQAASAVLHVSGQHTNLNPAAPIKAAIDDGTLTDVTLTNADGVKVTGAFNAAKTAWQSTEDLGYGKTYELSVKATDANGNVLTKSASYTMLTPGNMTMPYLNNVYGTSLVQGGTYGIGVIPVVHFDEHVVDEKAAEKALTVTVTTPGGHPARTPGGHTVQGAWAWIDDQNAHWRSSSYLPPGSRVTITAKLYGVNVGGPGGSLYGQADKSVSFKIGASHIAIADDSTHMVNVYFSGKLVKQMPTSMGQGGYVTGGQGQQIPLWTMPGTYTVLGFENPAIMSSDSYGLPANSPKGYAPEKVYWSTKISTDGIYLHELDATVWAQGSQDLSHGCLNLNQANAQWYFQHSYVGDIVQVKNVHQVDGQSSAGVAWWQGGDWDMSWSKWLSYSALHGQGSH